MPPEPAIDASIEQPIDAAEAFRGYRRRYFGPLLLLLQGARVATAWLWMLFLIPYSMDISYPEGAVVSRAFDAARGLPAYEDWRVWPHRFAPYAPLTYYPVGWAARALFGADLRPQEVYRAGRVQSLMAIAGICAILFSLARKLGAPRVWAFIAASMYLGFEPLLTFGASYRPDAPMAFFSLLALWIACGGAPTARRAVAAFGCLSVSMWFKTTAWGALFALGWWVWRSRGWRGAFAALGAFMLANLAVALMMNWATEGRLFLNMVDSLDNGWNPPNVVRFYSSAHRGPLAILVIGAAFALATLVRERVGNDPARLISLAALAAYGVATLQNFKIGADVNYYMEAYALASACAACGVARLWRGEIPLAPRWRELALYAFVIPAAVFDARAALRTIRGDLKLAKEAWAAPPLALKARDCAGPILTANPSLALERPAEPTIMDFVQYQILVERGALAPADLFKKLEEGRFQYVIISASDLGPDGQEWPSSRVKRAILDAYEKKSEAAESGSLVFLEPRRRAAR